MKSNLIRVVYTALGILGIYRLYYGHAEHRYNLILEACLELGCSLWLMHYPLSWCE